MCKQQNASAICEAFFFPLHNMYSYPHCKQTIFTFFFFPNYHLLHPKPTQNACCLLNGHLLNFPNSFHRTTRLCDFVYDYCWDLSQTELYRYSSIQAKLRGQLGKKNVIWTSHRQERKESFFRKSQKVHGELITKPASSPRNFNNVSLMCSLFFPTTKHKDCVRQFWKVINTLIYHHTNLAPTIFYKYCKGKNPHRLTGEKIPQEVSLFRNNNSVQKIIQKEALDKLNVFQLELKEDFVENIFIF